MESLRELLESSRLSNTSSPVDPIIAIFNHLHLQETLDLDEHKELFNLVVGSPSLEQVLSPYLGFISKLVTDSMDISPEGTYVYGDF